MFISCTKWALHIFYSRSEIMRRLVMPHELILGFFLHHICSRQIFCLSSCVTRWRSTDTSISVMAFEHPLTPSPTSMIDTQWRHYLGTDSRLLIILDCTQTCVAVLLRFKTFSICYGFGLSNVNWIPSTEDISLSHKYSRKMFWPLIVSVTKYFRRMCSAWKALKAASKMGIILNSSPEAFRSLPV